MKKVIQLACASLLLVGVISPALANSDDTKWINHCVIDNVKDKAAQKQTGKVILDYCTCMNGKMSENETQSVSEWEKAHPKENEACSKDAGWKE